MSERENFFVRWSRRKRVAAHESEQVFVQDQRAESSSARETRIGAEEVRPPGTPTPNSSPPQVGRARLAHHVAQPGQAPVSLGGENPAVRLPTQREAAVAAGEKEYPVDLPKLPPIESITAETDISSFLAPGVPMELTRAALRRAWSADPRIRDFIGPSESSWDFNAPDAMGGFGPLEMTDELRRQLLQMVGFGDPDEVDPAGKTDSQTPVEQPADQSAPTHANAPTEEEQKSAPVALSRNEPTSDTEPCAQHDNEDAARPVVKRSHGGALPR